MLYLLGVFIIIDKNLSSNIRKLMIETCKVYTVYNYKPFI